MGRRRRHISREIVSLCLPCWQVLGRRRDGARCLARGQRLREKGGSEPSCPARPSSFVREIMSHSRRRIGTDSISPRPRFGSDYGAPPWLQTADQRSGQRPNRYRTVAPKGNGRPACVARCRTKWATWRRPVKLDHFRVADHSLAIVSSVPLVDLPKKLRMLLQRCDYSLMLHLRCPGFWCRPDFGVMFMDGCTVLNE